jgi:SAM-dependent methyltransferase
VPLALQPAVGHLLVTDPSPAFCRITQKKLNGQDSLATRVDIALLNAEDIERIPAGSVQLIFLRSVLHHILNVEEFLARCAKVLPPGGLLICEEPYYDGYLMMGFLAQFIPSAIAAAGDACSPAELELVDYFIATMQFYGRRDLDKTEAEDKHLFRPDELFVSGRAAGLDLVHYPNWHIDFRRFLDAYLRRCMNWPPEFCDRVYAATAKYFLFFEPIESTENTVPYCFGTFVFTRRGA